jgi:hypothetical protein
MFSPPLSSNVSQCVILFLAANPLDTSKLRLDEEVRQIDEGLLRSPHRQQFELIQKWAVTAQAMQRAILETQPQMVHFSGHGTTEGLALNNETGRMQLVSAAALSALFGLCRGRVQGVLLNACWSQVQAEAIAQQVPYVIGMNRAIGDQAARVFAVGFYDALGRGEGIPEAYQAGRVSLMMQGIPEDLTPVLLSGRLGSGSAASSTSSSTSSSTGSSMGAAVESADARDISTRPQSAGTPPVVVPPVAVVLENPEGSVGLASPFYMERPPIEADCYQEILRPSALIRIRAPRQMGKTSLLQRILHQARQHGQQTAYLNFQTIDSEFLESTDLLLQWFCSSVSQEVELPDRLEDFWRGVLGSKNKCTNYFQRYLLKDLPQPLTLGLDEVDVVFHHLPLAQDFFGLLRAWHEKSKNEPVWQKLRLVIAHSREVYIPLDINQSPFNVGLPIKMPKLTAAQAQELMRRHGLEGAVPLQALMELVGGHPYLVRKALYEIARGHLSFAELQQTAPTEAGVYSDHLRRHLHNLEKDPQLEAAMRQVVFSLTAVRLEPELGFKLDSMGLVDLLGNEVMPLCQLYRLYFRDRLGVQP